MTRAPAAAPTLAFVTLGCPKNTVDSESMLGLLVQAGFRTVGDVSCTCPVASLAADVDAIIAETAAATVTERGATRMDDQTSDASMEKRKKEGYF